MYESFLADWLLFYIKPFLDPNQCGVKGSSITHYLIKLLHFVHQTLDQKKPHVVLTACFDLSKAFNRVDHILVIQDLFDMHTPAWLLNIVVSYLTNRTMKLTYNGSVSALKNLPAGTPQGAFLGGLIFIVKFNGAFLRPPIPCPRPLHDSSAVNVKYIDDGTVAVSVNLKSALIIDLTDRPRPVTYSERSGHILPPQNNLLQYYVKDTENFASQNNMKINKKKTHLIKFTNARKLDFPAEVQFSDGTLLESVQQTTLLGVVVSSDLKWKKNTEYICEKARKKLWILLRMMKLNLSDSELFDVYQKEVRSILEFVAPVWHSSLTRRQTSEIESIQKFAFKIILGKTYTSYESACAKFATQTLEQRRLSLCLRFALKNINSNISMFIKPNENLNLRRKKNLVKEYKCNKAKFQRSSLPFLAKLANSRS